MLGKLILPEIQELLFLRDFSTIKEVLSELEVTELAGVIAEFPESDQALLFRILPRELAADAFEYLDLDGQIQLLKGMAQEQVAMILDEMSPDDRTALLEELPAPVTRQLLALISPEERAIAQKLLAYPENSIGRLMTPNYIAVQIEWTVAEVLDYVRKNAEDSETLNVIYVVDQRGKLIDDIRIREFLLSPLDKTVFEIMDGNFIALTATDDQEKSVELFRKYDRIALPVRDSDGTLVGIVTVDDVLDVAEEEATEDIHKLGGMEALDEPYMDISFFDMVKKRASWLVILFVGEMLTATAMSVFEDEIAKAVVLALFLPLIISSGGNSGSQASTLVIRAMALGEITLLDWWRVMKREVMSGFTLGMILGIIGFIRVAVWSVAFRMYGAHWFLIALTVMFSLIGVVMWGTLSGSMLPFILRKFGIDPATSSAPFVATLSDVTGLVIYFMIALFLLRGTLL